jgi:hypothetical protein
MKHVLLQITLVMQNLSPAALLRWFHKHMCKPQAALAVNKTLSLNVDATAVKFYRNADIPSVGGTRDTLQRTVIVRGHMPTYPIDDQINASLVNYDFLYVTCGSIGGLNLDYGFAEDCNQRRNRLNFNRRQVGHTHNTIYRMRTWVCAQSGMLSENVLKVVRFVASPLVY